MRKTVIASAGVLFIMFAIIVLGGCGHFHHGHWGSHAHASAHHQGPGCGHPQGQ